MENEIVNLIPQVGSAGIATLLLWLVYKDTSRRLDEKDTAFRALEKEVRTEITVQLAASTSTLRDVAKVMDRVVEKLNK